MISTSYIFETPTNIKQKMKNKWDKLSKPKKVGIIATSSALAIKSARLGYNIIKNNKEK